MTKRFSAQKFKSMSDVEFNPIAYSRFKFGCKDVAREFGTYLAQRFWLGPFFNEIVKLVKDKKAKGIIVLSSPYNFIPTATFAMKDYFIRELNVKLIAKGLSPCKEAKISRDTSYKEDYGEMSAAQRLKLISGDNFQVDAKFIEGHVCLFLDDVIITGGHERVIQKMLSTYKLEDKIFPYFLYYGELVSTKTNPKIENALNYAFVKNLLDLDKIIKNENFLLNTRTVKYILNSDHEECKVFLQYQSSKFIESLYHSAIGNGYHTEPDYKENFKYLSSLIYS